MTTLDSINQLLPLIIAIYCFITFHKDRNYLYQKEKG